MLLMPAESIHHDLVIIVDDIFYIGPPVDVFTPFFPSIAVVNTGRKQLPGMRILDLDLYTDFTYEGGFLPVNGPNG